MAKLSGEDARVRAEGAWRDKDHWKPMLQDAYRLALPMRNLFDTKQKGADKNSHVFDSTLQNSTVRAANRLQTELTPPFTQWADLVPGAFVPPEQRDKVRKELERFTGAAFAAINISNFDTAINELYLDLLVGTGVMLVQDGGDRMPVRFVVVPYAQVALESGPFGDIWGFYRKVTMPARNVKPTWPDMIVPEGWQKMLTDDPKAEVTLNEMSYYDADDDVWHYQVFWSQSKGQGKGVTDIELVHRESDETEWLAVRWIKVAGETSGRGPVLFALPDAKTLNKVKELILRAAALSIAGVWTAVDDGVLNPNKVRITPGAVIPVGRNRGATLGPSLAPLDFGGRVDLAQLVINDLQSSIKEAMMDRRLPEETAQPRSATEFLARMQQLQQDIGSPFGRLMSELIRPVFQKVLNILTKRGVVRLPDGGRIKVDGAFVDVQVTSPLAQAQNLSELERAVQWITMNQQVAPNTTELGVRVEQFPAWSAEKLSVDTQLVRPEDERAQLEQVAGRLAAQQAGAGAGVAPGGAAPLGGAGELPLAA